jgi:AbrB family looped-hinge helix DNA binding protein
MKETSAHVAENGRLVIPAPFRKALGLEAGGDVVLRLEKNELRIVTKRQHLAQARAIIRRHVPKNISLADELIKERREAAKFE